METHGTTGEPTRYSGSSLRDQGYEDIGMIRDIGRCKNWQPHMRTIDPNRIFIDEE